MRAHALNGLALLTLMLPGAAPAPAEPPGGQPTEAEIQKGQDLVNARLQQFNARGAQVRHVDDPAVAAALPGDLCYAVLFRQYPVARPAPEPLKSGNVFVVTQQGKVEVLSDAKAQERFFRGALRPVKDDAAARRAAQAWLRLAEERHQDGFFQFTIPEKDLDVTRAPEARRVSGKARVAPKGGDRGEIRATLAFDGDGKLARAEEAAELQAGVRPICQATRLLDPDPVVRRMAEKDLLVLGRRAKPYLDEQRAQASAALRQAIDRVWQRILEEGW
jgi:hypothetical protein